MNDIRALVYEKNLHRAAELRRITEEAGFVTRTVFYPSEAEAVLRKERFDVLIVGWDALPLSAPLEKIAKIIVSVPHILRDDAEATALRYGLSSNIVEYPFKAREIVEAIGKTAPVRAPGAATSRRDVPSIIGASPEITEVKELLLKAAGTASTVLILGETGTGKELVARALHDLGPRKDRPFVALNCAATPETLLETEFFGHEKGAFTGAVGKRAGKFELADDGTIFLDEIGEISPSLQAKLLRVLESRNFYRVGGERSVAMNARIVCATNRNIFQMAQSGAFRPDLLYRINVVPVNLPALRERMGDLPPLAEHFLKKYSSIFDKTNVASFSDEAMEEMSLYPWPGNIRQLEHVVERAIIQCEGDVITNVRLETPEEKNAPIPPSVAEMAGLDYSAMKDKVMDFYEREYISALLAKTQGSLQTACEMSKMDRKTLYRKIKTYGLDKKDFKSKNR
ncbi:MAG: sigma-54-dependent Fis family transcriptional regulator [Nitrospinae bacterium]|nr:sigma-54-dependent Fis family transcriptional regulator [Nitrospinota bacterium]